MKHLKWAFVLTLIFLAQACTKCEVCMVNDAAGNELYSGESCGKKKIIDQGRENCENFAEVSGEKCVCMKKED